MNVDGERKQTLIREFRGKLGDIENLPRDCELERWIDATSENISESERLFRDQVKWRHDNKIDDLIAWRPPPVIQEYYPGGFAGYDEEGCPVWIIPFGGADVKGMLLSTGKDVFLDFTIKIVETSLALMRRKSQEPAQSPITKHVFIFDLEGFSLTAATNSDTLEILRRLISVYEKNYPETLKAAYVLNASNIFKIVFKIVQSTVQQKTLNKIKIFGSDNWPLEVKNFVTKQGQNINKGGLVTQSHYLLKGNDVKKQVINPGKSFTLKVTAKESSQLSWTFMTEGGDIAFTVFSQDQRVDNTKEKMYHEELIPKKRIPSHKEIQSDHIFCQPLNSYILEFDNSFSLMKPKTLLYTCKTDPVSTKYVQIDEAELLSSIRQGLTHIPSPDCG